MLFQNPVTPTASAKEAPAPAPAAAAVEAPVAASAKKRKQPEQDEAAAPAADAAHVYEDLSAVIRTVFAKVCGGAATCRCTMCDLVIERRISRHLSHIFNSFC